MQISVLVILARLMQFSHEVRNVGLTFHHFHLMTHLP